VGACSPPRRCHGRQTLLLSDSNMIGGKSAENTSDAWIMWIGQFFDFPTRRAQKFRPYASSSIGFFGIPCLKAISPNEVRELSSTTTGREPPSYCISSLIGTQLSLASFILP
jgi:hypothetical protein